MSQHDSARGCSPYTSIDLIKKAIVLLEGRLTNVKELPIHAYYLFEEPNMESEEATAMQATFDPQTQGLVTLYRDFYRSLTRFIRVA